MVAIFPPKLSLHNRFRTWTFLAYIWPFSYMYGNIMRQVYYPTYRSCIGAKMVTFSIPYYNHPVQDSSTRPSLRGHRRGQPARLRTQAARRSTLKRPRQQTTFTFLFLLACTIFFTWSYSFLFGFYLNISNMPFGKVDNLFCVETRGSLLLQAQ